LVSRASTFNVGCFSWCGSHVFTSSLLARHSVGLLQTDDDEWELHYGPILLAYVLRRGGNVRLEPLR
jgi:hypothetical protein